MNCESFDEIDAGLTPRRVRAVHLAETARPAEAEPGPPGAGPGELDRLYAGLSGVTVESHPRTARLLASGRRRAAQKVIEEAGEVALEAVKCRAAGLVRESADLLYHLVVLWHRAHIDPADVYSEMQRRADAMGIAEKLRKAPRPVVSSRGSRPKSRPPGR
jgi:phosphoribosyl-ATP pyrophosphohydrolase